MNRYVGSARGRPNLFEAASDDMSQTTSAKDYQVFFMGSMVAPARRHSDLPAVTTPR
jgi:hypothetical protein